MKNYIVKEGWVDDNGFEYKLGDITNETINPSRKWMKGVENWEEKYRRWFKEIKIEEYEVF